MNLTKALLFLAAALLVAASLVGCGTQPTGQFTEKEVPFWTDDSYLAATLAVPDGKGPFPAVIIVGGSGPLDRNGDLDHRLVEASQQAGQPYLVANSTYRDIAQALSRAGFVTLRYDKRGIGNSTGPQGDFPGPSLRDLKAAVTFLRTQETVDPKRIALVGHSIGGLWVLEETVEDKDIAAVCLMATPAKPFGDVIVEQIEAMGKLAGANETAIESAVAKQRQIYEELNSGVLDPATLPEPSASQYQFIKEIMNLSGAANAKLIKCPSLIVQGEKDLFTTIPEEAQLLKQAFIQGGNQNVTLVMFPDLDHVFRPAPGEPSPQLYYENRGPISPEVVTTIVDWMTKTLH